MTGVTVGRSNYYTEVIARDDYYKEGGESPGRWYGKASERFALRDAEIGYKDKSLRNLMLGKDPHTQEQLRNVSLTSREYKTKDPVTGKETVERSDPKLAWDFTFSAPKSVSVLWSVADDETRRAIEAAQRTAVEAAVTAIEEKASYTRTGRGGVNQQSMEVAFAAFDHTTSRALDPHLHTHVLLLNTGIREDGKGGTIDARGIFQTGVHTFGTLYATSLKSLVLRCTSESLKRGRPTKYGAFPKHLSPSRVNGIRKFVPLSPRKNTSSGVGSTRMKMIVSLEKQGIRKSA
jgi:conjugative relaxase-like TrwC/TraI family protein